MSTIRWGVLATRMAGCLAEGGALRDPAWRKVFESTPRHLFVPRFYGLDGHGRLGRLVSIDGETAEDDALAMAYANQALVTHYAVAGTTPDGAEVRVPTSSASMPYVVAVMLDRLDVRDGHRVLEIGTGTGYNAALLATRLGEENVTSVELEEQSAAEAAEHLAAAGHHPSLVVGDGAAGAPDRAPYDRIVATCSISQVPTAWLQQLAPAGRIVAPLTFGSALAVLDRTDDGGLAGRIDPELVSFMTMRGVDFQPEPVTIRRPQGVPHRGLTNVDPRLLDPFGQEHDFRLWLTLHLPDANLALTCDDDGNPAGILLTTADSYAEVPYDPATARRWPVTQLGHRRLWDTVETACASYGQQGGPSRDRLGITVNEDGDQYLWLDENDGPYSWPMPL